jgi:hypothetical protein
VPKPLIDGQQREIKASRDFSMFTDHSFKVIAERYDCDTPYVHVGFGSDLFTLTDAATRDLIDRLQRALSVLPTSK